MARNWREEFRQAIRDLPSMASLWWCGAVGAFISGAAISVLGLQAMLISALTPNPLLSTGILLIVSVFTGLLFVLIYRVVVYPIARLISVEKNMQTTFFIAMCLLTFFSLVIIKLQNTHITDIEKNMSEIGHHLDSNDTKITYLNRTKQDMLSESRLKALTLSEMSMHYESFRENNIKLQGAIKIYIDYREREFKDLNGATTGVLGAAPPPMFAQRKFEADQYYFNIGIINKVANMLIGRKLTDYPIPTDPSYLLYAAPEEPKELDEKKRIEYRKNLAAKNWLVADARGIADAANNQQSVLETQLHEYIASNFF